MNTINLSDPSMIFALIGVIALIGTLGFLAVQISQIRTQMRSQMYADLIDKDRELAKYFIERPEIAGMIYGKGHLLYGNNDTDAKEIWATILAADFYENIFVQKNFNTIPKELWPHWQKDVAKGWVLSQAYHSCHWPKLQALYWSKFVKQCEKIEKEESGMVHKSLFSQVEGLSELIPGPLSSSIDDIRKLISLARDNVVVGPSQIVPGELGYLAARNIGKGELVFSVFGTIIGYQTPRYSIQIGYGIHIDPHVYGGRYVNHHCEGNLIIEWDNRGLHNFIAAKDIKKGEEISYAYWRTELLWSESASETKIKCSCGSSKCKGRIFSFRELSPEDKKLAFKEGGIAWYLYSEQASEG